MTTYSTIYGIDVSKDTLDLCKLNEGQSEQSSLKNRHKNIEKFAQKLQDQNILCVLEPTGSYSDQLLYTLNKYGIAVSLISPGKSNGFFHALGVVSKNDKQAAKGLALMGQRLDLPLHQPKSDEMLKRKQIQMGINAFKKQRQALVSQLHALKYQVQFEPKVQQMMEQTLETVEKNIAELEEQLKDISDEEHARQYALTTTIVGFGPKTAHLLLTATNGLHHFETAGQLAKLAGVVPSSHYSGSSVHKKGRITKKGNTELRASLYMAASSAKRYNHACKALYERLRSKGKPHKKAMVAVMNKLLRQAFGVVKTGVSFDNQRYLDNLSITSAV